jgi:hypothetical protein
MSSTLGGADLSPQIDEEFARLTARNLKAREETSEQIKVVAADLVRIQDNIVRTAEDALFTEKKIASYASDIDGARRAITKEKALLLQIKLALEDEWTKLITLNAMSDQL